MAYELISYKYNGTVCWTLLDSEHSTPPLYALIYSALKLRRNASNTQHIHATALRQFYEYIQFKHQRTVESYIKDLGLWAIINELVGFAVYLESGRKGVNLISLSGSENTESTNSTRIRHVCKFLIYLNERYTTRTYNPHITSELELRRNFNTNKFLIKSKREELTHSGSKGPTAALPEYYKSLTFRQLQVFKTVIYPHTNKKRNPCNPFTSVDVSFRNYLIATLMLEYGLRRGEVCLLTTFSFKPNMVGTKYYLVVTSLDEDEGGDPRSSTASIKTKDSHRTLQISKDHYLFLRHYVENIRPESDSDLLFVAKNTGEPLSMRMINKLFQAGFTVSIHQNFPEITDKDSLEYLPSYHPHKLRHTWAVAQLAYLCQVVKKTLNEAKDLLRINGGWSIKSTMPDYYGRRYLADEANAMNLRRILDGE